MRHSLTVRLTHWVNFAGFAGLLISGIAILLAHPRLYWGETGSVGTPSLIDLPLPFVLTGQSGWGRSLHFQSAWVCVLTGMLYVSSGLVTRHFRRDFLPAKADGIPGAADSPGYGLAQRLIYSLVVFVLFPFLIWTGLAMSPAITSVYPALVDVLGGQQSARTLHFFGAALLVLFVVVHIGMIVRTGFLSNLRGMIVGFAEPRRPGKEQVYG